MLRRRTAFALFVVAALAATAWAQEWHEAYRDGVKALAQGQPARAVVLLEAAATQRPQPGRNVITYGTNVVERYYPYLRLAEAHLALRNVAAARAALRRSETFAREPAEDRQRLAAQVDELAARLAPPVAVAASVAPPPPPVTTPSAAVEAVPPPTTAAADPRVVPAPHAVPIAPRTAAADPVEHARHADPPPMPAPRASPVAAPDPTTLEVVSQPPGARVYLDGELIGATDAEWGGWSAAATLRVDTASGSSWPGTAIWSRTSSSSPAATPSSAGG